MNQNQNSNDSNKFNLEQYIHNFVYSNWDKLKYTFKIEDIEVEIKTEEEIADEELFYKDIVYNE